MRSAYIHRLYGVSILVTLVFFVAFLLASPAQAINVPRYIGFQGQLTDSSGDALTGTYSMTFRIYDSLTGGTALWSETQPSVSVSSGFFGVSLGDVTALTLPFDTRYWVSVEVSSDGEMTPRQAIDSVATSYSSDITYGAYVSSTAPTTSSGKLYYDSDEGNLYVFDHISQAWVDVTATSSGGGGAPTGAQYLVTATSSELSAEVLVSSLGANLTFAGDDTATRTLTFGQTGTFRDLVVFDADNISLSSAGALTVSSSITGASLLLQDTASDNTLQLVFNEDAGANRVLNLTLGDGSRALALNEDFTIGGGSAGTLTYTTATTLTVEAASTINQDLTTDANPTFAGATTDGIQLGVTAANEIDTSAGNLILDSAGGTVQVDDILSVTGNASVTGDSTLGVLSAATTTLATTTISNTLTVTGAATFANLTNTTGTFNALYLQDTAADNTLQLVFNEDNISDRVLNLVLGDGDRNLTLNENFTIGGGTAGTLTYTTDTTLTVEASSAINQDLTTDATVVFGTANVNFLGLVDDGGIGSDYLTFTQTGDLSTGRSLFLNVADGDRTLALNENFTVGGGSAGTLTYGATTTLTVEATSTLNQDLTTDANPTFAGATTDGIQLGVTAANEIDTSAGNLILDSAGGTVQVDDQLIALGIVELATTTVTGTLAATGTISAPSIIGTSALGFFDTGADHFVTISSGENNTANRALVLNVNDGARTLDIQGDAVINQDVDTSADVTFNSLRLQDTSADNTLQLVYNEDGSANRVLNIEVVDSDRTLNLGQDFTIGNDSSGTLTYQVETVLTVEATSTIDQDLTTDADPQFNTIFLQDTAGDNTVNIIWNENATGDYALNLDLNDDSRTLTMNNSFTIGGGSDGTLTYSNPVTLTVATTSTIDQDLAVSSEPQFGSLFLDDTAANNTLQLVFNENNAANRVLNLIVGDGDRTLTMNENLTIGDGSAGTLTYTGAFALSVEANVGLDQDLATDSNVSFDTIAVNDLSNNNTLTISNSTEELTANRTLDILVSDANRTLTVETDVTLDQDVGQTSDVQFNTVAFNDSGQDHIITISGSEEDNTLDRTLNITLGDSDRSLNILDNFTVGNGGAGTLTYSADTILTVEATSTIDQDVTLDADVQFNTLALTDAGADNIATITFTEDQTNDRALNISLADADRNVTFESDVTFDQDVSTAADVTFSTGTFNNLLSAAAGINISSPSTDNRISDASVGAGSATLYIGNRTIDTTASDERLKTNIQSSEVDVFALFNQMNIVDFDWIEGDAQAGLGRMTGLIAQEVDEYLPQLVRKGADPESYWSVYYSYMVPYTIKAIKEQQEQIETLSAALLQDANVAVDDSPVDGVVTIAGHVNYGSDTVGQARILAGQTEVRIIFETPYSEQPIVVATPRRVIVGVSSYAVTDESETGFTIELSPAQNIDTDFNWHAFGANGGMLTVSNGQEFDIDLEIGPGSILPPEGEEEEEPEEEENDAQEEDEQETASSTASGLDEGDTTSSTTSGTEEETDTTSSTTDNKEPAEDAADETSEDDETEESESTDESEDTESSSETETETDEEPSEEGGEGEEEASAETEEAAETSEPPANPPEEDLEQEEPA